MPTVKSVKSCSEVLQLLHDYVDEDLPQSERRVTAIHLRTCAECRTALKELRCTRRLLRRLPREPMPDPMKKTILDALRRHDRSNTSDSDQPAT
jgi:anti-sigma factor RsiW